MDYQLLALEKRERYLQQPRLDPRIAELARAMAGPAPKPRQTASTGSASGRPIDAKRLQDSDTGARVAHKDRVMADIPPHSRKAARQSIRTMVLRYHRPTPLMNRGSIPLISRAGESLCVVCPTPVRKTLAPCAP